MRFTIRHLLWFTFLAAVGCWWWLPSDNDAVLVTKSRYSLNSSQEVRRWSSPPQEILGFANFGFQRRDLVAVPADPHDGLFSPSPREPRLKNRGHGLFVFSLPFTNDYVGALANGISLAFVSTAKYSWVIQVTEFQALLIDIAVGIVLATLALGSLFFGRRVQK